MALATEPWARGLHAEPVMIDVETARTAQQALAHAAGISQAYVPNIENGRNEPSPAVLRDLAKALDARVDELLREPDAATGEPAQP